MDETQIAFTNYILDKWVWNVHLTFFFCLSLVDRLACVFSFNEIHRTEKYVPHLDSDR